jgi:hypothetical protein
VEVDEGEQSGGGDRLTNGADAPAERTGERDDRDPGDGVEEPADTESTMPSVAWGNAMIAGQAGACERN